MLPPSLPLDIHDPNASERWKKFKNAWDNYSMAMKLNKEEELVQVATLLTVIGEEAQEVFTPFLDWKTEGNEKKIGPVLQTFSQYCQPCKNVPFERFNHCMQVPGEQYDQYRTALRKVADGCDFETITPEEILRDHLVFSIVTLRRGSDSSANQTSRLRKRMRSAVLLNVAGVQRLLGMTQYLMKFLPRLSDITKPMRDLTQKGVE